MEIKLTTLCENSVGGHCLGEWGLSVFVEADGQQILFDTGGGASLAHNVQVLRVDLAAADRIVISHGHYDHTGGLNAALQLAGPKEIVAHPDIWAPKYGRMESNRENYVGIPFVREKLEAMGAVFKLTDQPVKLSEHITTTGVIPRLNDYEIVEEYLLVKENGRLRQDELNDDLALVIDADFGLVVVLGCAHHGIVNTLQHAMKLTGKDRVYAAIGGTHLVHASPERIALTAAALKEMGVQYLGVSHCTGFGAASYLYQEFGRGFFMNNAGTRLVLPFKEK